MLWDAAGSADGRTTRTRPRGRLALQQRREHREVPYLRRFDVPRQGCLSRRLPVYKLLSTHQCTLSRPNPLIPLT
jgi:hypothetical protein